MLKGECINVTVTEYVSYFLAEVVAKISLLFCIFQGVSQGGKSGAAPVYARIITPPPGIRLTAMRPGQQGLQMIQIPQQQQQQQQDTGNGTQQQGENTNSQ